MGTPNDTKTADCIAKEWLTEFSAAMTGGDVKAATALYMSDGWLRDVLVFTWNHRSLSGHDAISAYLTNHLRDAKLQNIKLDYDFGIMPTFVKNPSLGRTLLEASFTFETPIAYGRAHIWLQKDQCDEWKALTTYLALEDLKGHEERGFESGLYDGHTTTWDEVQAERTKRIEEDPHVLIIGAAQTGLNVGARFRQMGIPTLLIDKSNRVGDVWRDRYPTLTLHTPNGQHGMLYQRFPKNWPRFTPRSKVAAWLEQYAKNQDLVIWLNSTVAPTPSYDSTTKRWSVTVLKNGKPVVLHPYHIVSAMGTLGKPMTPHLPGQSDFKGEAFHGTDFRGGQVYAGKKVVVIGTGNTAADMCQDLASRGAASVTMVQRSTTVVIDAKHVHADLEAFWPWQGNTDIGDFRYAAVPLGVLRKIGIGGSEVRKNAQKDMLEGLREKGLRLDDGPDAAGFLFLVFERFGGYWVDVGAAEMIINGKIVVKSGEPVAFNSEGLMFRDGSTLETDLVIFATGYHSIVDRVREIFGDELADKATPVWGLNKEFELNKCYTPTGQPGFWYALGDFSWSRYYSKSLALQIKARELGLVKD